MIRVERELFMFAKPQTVLYIDPELISEFSLMYNYIQIALHVRFNSIRLGSLW